ncbi:type I-E CRISPR-associated protein Cas7/Cse4/CasC [Actinocorallia sp. API 0066]|uniref:type I-E CRISPR-associated protein Cas7/Cse4/CasC n=1 Tax=Actinocorallia sp. API 0066 TaxID=2896846 RepID=UPI001E2E50DA|nr:type I-E CRISPR-associated protein Cas7/Cse4/CasC [Actinocorallia sp. API 0066]MCD0452841.1 type I-E CRISPR-associated protein Cas7/Cse4/CasC [Actinocorallia sp. API 0066]
MSQRQYIDFHILQTVPPANLNRDDNGNPKEARFGGVRRSRVSSQAWKRATRKAFDERLPEPDQTTRTKRIAGKLADRIEKKTKIGEEQSLRIANALLEPLGIKPGKKPGDTAYLLFFGNRQLDGITDLVADQAKTLAELDDSGLKETVKGLAVADELKTGHTFGTALFGRMVADIPALNVDAAVQVAHALSTHAVDLESDYYTAVDDENEADETGAGMIGNVGFNSATLYRYASVGIHQLVTNLGDVDAAIEAVDLFAQAFALSMPTGHINSFAHRTRPSLVAVVVRDDQPVNLVSAFENPIRNGQGIAVASARALATEYAVAVKQWGDVPDFRAVSHSFIEPTLDEAFGDNRTFAELRAALTERLGAAWKQQ